MRAKIQNIDDLRSEMNRLRMERINYENDFHQVAEKVKAKLNVPVRIYKKVTDFFGSFFGGDDTNPTKKENVDWVTNIFRVGLPVFMNKFFFPKSGVFMKSVVAMMSAKAAKNINKDTITDLIEKATEWIKSSTKPKSRKDPVLADYGIPPDSETY